MVVSDQKRAFGVFSSGQEAEQALTELKASGFPMEKVSIIGKHVDAKQADQYDQLGGAQISDRVGNKNLGSATAVVADTLAGSFWGTVLVGLGSLALPGIGPVIAAGSLGLGLVSSIAGFGIGAVNASGLVRALADLGIPEEQARVYSDRLQQGDYFVIVDGTDEEIHRAEALFTNRGIQNWGIYNPPKA